MKDSGMTAGAGTEAPKPEMNKNEKFRKTAANINSLIDFIGMLLFRLRKTHGEHRRHGQPKASKAHTERSLQG